MNPSLRPACALALVLTTGCATIVQPVQTPHIARLSVGKMDERTDFENERDSHESDSSDLDE